MANAIEDEHYINWNQFVLPHDYGDAEREYSAIRNSCAMFDVSPIRKIRVSGAGAGDFFDHLLTRPVSELPAMRAMYTVFCNEDGSLKDDAILYKFTDDDTLVGSVNCSGWSWGMNRTIGNASIKSEHAALEHAWIELGGKRLQVLLSRGPLITLERRNRVPASL